MTSKLLAQHFASVVILASAFMAPMQALALQTQGRPAKPPKQRLEVTVEEATGNYIFRYKAYDGSPIEIVFVPATKIRPAVRATFSFDPATGLTTYEFHISNGNASKQELSNFKVKVTPPVEDIQTPDGWEGHGPAPATNVVSWFQLRGGTFVGGLVQPRGLLPGQSLDGFSFQSPNLPGVVKVYFRGNTREWPSPPGATSEISRQMSRYTWWENDSVRKVTIGPAIQIDDLDPYEPTVHLGRLRENLMNELAHNMIPSQNLRQTLYGRLAQARAALQAEQPDEARKHLAAILEELTYQPETNISVDLVRAIVINLNFALGRLP
jgi:hypothetical protein